MRAPHEFLVRRVYEFADVEGEAALAGIDHNMVAMPHRAVEDLHGERVLHQPLDRALQRTRSIRAVVAGFEDRLARGCVSSMVILRSASSFSRSARRRSMMCGQLLFAERMEDHDVVDAVEELRTEVLAQHTHDALASPPRSPPHSRSTRSASCDAPRFDVMMSTVFLKSTVRPLESVRRPSSSTCRSTLKTSGCAFSISSKRTTA